MNRVTEAIKKTEERIQIVLKTPDGQAKVDKCDKGMDATWSEYVKWQEIKSLAVVNGKLTLEEGMTIYGIMGNTLEHFNGQPVAHKVVVAKIISELLATKFPR